MVSILFRAPSQGPQMASNRFESELRLNGLINFEMAPSWKV